MPDWKWDLIMILAAAAAAVVCMEQTVVFLINFWKKYEDKRYFFCSFFLGGIGCILGYGSLAVSEHYSVDSFNMFFDMSPYWHLSIGRYMNCGVILAAQRLGINQVVSHQFFMCIWIITLILMQVMIAAGIVNCMKGRAGMTQCILVQSAVLLSFLNIFAMELMLFTEMAMVLILGNLAVGLAVFTILSSRLTWKKRLLFLFYALTALGCYQSYLGIFLSFAVAGIYIRWQEDWKKRYQESAAVMLAGILASAVNVWLVKVLLSLGVIQDSGRGAAFSFRTVIDNIKNLILYQLHVWRDADGIMQPFVMPVFGAALVCIFVLVLRRIKNIEQKIYLCFLAAGCYILGFAPHIVESRLTLTPRSSIAVWSAISVILILGIYAFRKEKTLSRFLGIVMTVFLINQVIVMTDMASNEQAMNAVDFIEAQIIAERVLEYEADTGNKITKVAAKGDKNSVYYQPGSNYRNYELGARIMSTYYSNYRLIGYMLDRPMERVDMPQDIYAEYFEGRDWNYLEVEEQTVCIGDTLYLMIY